MRVLIISYYWPPAGGSGVQRWLKFVKYFRDFGIEPVVFCPENPNYPIKDYALEGEIPEGIEILKLPIRELGKPSIKQAGFLSKKKSLKTQILTYIRANLVIPDTRFLWIKPATKYLTKYLKSAPVDFVISTGPPHSMHLIALELKKDLGVPWLADFRDPWTDIDFFHHLPFNKWAWNKHLKLEQEVLTHADIVTVVSEQMRLKYLKYNKHTALLYNGFDGALADGKEKLDDKFSLVHVGLINADRCPYNLLEVLGELKDELQGFQDDLEITLVGKTASELIEKAIENGLESNLNLIDYLPHDEISVYQERAQLLLLLLNDVPSAKGIITGKVFEYFRAQRPILAIGPKGGNLDDLLQETQSGQLFDFSNKVDLKSYLRLSYEAFKENGLHVNSKNITSFHRKALTKQLAELIKNYGQK